MCIMCLKLGDDPAFCDPTHPRVATQGQNPPNPDPFMGLPPGNGGTPVPAQPPQGTPAGGISVKKPGPGLGATPPPITRTNQTGDPRVVWEDGQIAIIYAKDFPANSGMGRSKTRGQLTDAIKATIDDQLQTMPGAGSANDFVKVWLKELLARPSAGMAQPKVVPRLPIDPIQFRPVAPKIATGGTYKGQVIPDFPHDCEKCGGKYYQGNFSSIHPTPDGLCPNDRPEKKPSRRR